MDSTCSLREIANLRAINVHASFIPMFEDDESFSKENDGHNIDLLNFGDKFISVDQVLTQMNSFGYRPATLRELMSLAEDVLKRYEIVALGTFVFNGYPCSFYEDNEILIRSGTPSGIINTHNDLRRLAAVIK